MTGTVSESAGIPSAAQLARAAEDAACAKATARPLTSFLLGITAGGYIALAFVFWTTSQVGAQALPWGVAKVLGGVVFSTGIVLVVLTGAELFTSSTLTLTARASGRISWAQLLRNWAVVYAGNLLGALTVVVLVYAGGTWHAADGAWGRVVLDTAASKVGHSFGEAFVLGVLCNLMVCVAVWAAYSGRTTTDKVLALTLPIALFVSAGFEHSVANMFLLPLALLLQGTAGVELAVEGATLTWDAVVVGNLLPVTLGNVVGGGVMIGLMYWTIFRRPGRH
ncbi:formate transporter [Georgenia satyanarayanai]|uniref:Formate transporter n=1 Tax=Georgenia satyanarayanai TaxID=860221 RepID=A0A2Y9APT6_9MICO|nr:formate transporter FocA [Georgenia satyanarayanai]PYF96794.1 formate transporter [Georgenia satyanarayanai]SSA46390.1 formate transporter [Georgenia satyanarayanai]